MRYLGKDPSSGMHTRIKRMILLHDIDTSHFTGQGWNKGNISYKSDEVFAEGSKRSRGVVRGYVIRDHLIPYKCAFCGNTGEWQGKPMALELDHINGIHNDHRLENLRFLCPNCHAITDTYCGKNIKKKNSQNRESKNTTPKESTRQIPEAKDLGLLSARMTLTGIARYYGVSPSTIERWCKELGIPHTIKELRAWAQETSIVSSLELPVCKKPKPKPKPQHFCAHCGKPLKTTSATLCLSCVNRRVLDRPTPIEIAQTVKEKGFFRGAKDYGVSDNAVRKWCDEYGIPRHTKQLVAWLDDELKRHLQQF